MIAGFAPPISMGAAAAVEAPEARFPNAFIAVRVY